MDPAKETTMDKIEQKLGVTTPGPTNEYPVTTKAGTSTMSNPNPVTTQQSGTIKSLADRLFNSQTPAYSGNNQASSLAKVADANVNFNPLSAGIRAVGDIGSSIVNGAFGLAAQDRSIDWQRQQWSRDWNAAQQMGLYSPSQIANATSGNPSSSDIYTLNSRGLRRQPRTMPGSQYGT